MVALLLYGYCVGVPSSDFQGSDGSKARHQSWSLIYARRKVIPEPVFGQIKEARGFRRFLLRGMSKVRGEWSLITLTHNIFKLHIASTA